MRGSLPARKNKLAVIDALPHLNATLNACSAVLLVTGLVFIKLKRREAHKRCMLAALTASGIFLVSYITYHSVRGTTVFPESGAARIVYLSILYTHMVLAVGMLPFIWVTFRRAFRGEFERHARIARITFPIWLYVSVTGVVVYWMLYHLYPAGVGAHG
ncbi:MAG: DUF420 domain-containing protein [Planctomycetes bacterium]|nr:DUF420 domain-containing protein [Planctomycetota bacterium]